MYENNNKEVVRELAAESLKSHPYRNATVILAIALTTILITALLSVGTSLLSTAVNAEEQTPGPNADGYLTGSYEHYEKAAALDEVEWADYVQICAQAPLHNKEFGGIETRLYAPDEGFYRDNGIRLLAGAYPDQQTDLLMSKTLAEELLWTADAEGEWASVIGREFTLLLPIREGEDFIEKEVRMRICGIYQNPLFAISSIYEELYTDASFIPAYNAGLDPQDNIIYIKLNNLNPLQFNTDVSSKLYEVQLQAGAPGFSPGKNTNDLLSAVIVMIPVLLFVLLLMASGYFLIYNVFYIPVINDIRMYGSLKTIGTTAPQLKLYLKLQINRLSIAGISAGIAAGYLIGLLAAPRVIGMTDWAVYYRKPDFLPVAAFAALFAWITVKISAGRPLRLASGISPIEAARYTPKRRKNIFTVISLALSGIIFLAVFTAVMGYDVEAFADRYNQGDYEIFHKASFWSIDEPYRPISCELPERLRALPFVADVKIAYSARTVEKEENEPYYPSSSGEIKTEGGLWDYLRQAYALEQDYTVNGVSAFSRRGNLNIGVSGIPGDTLPEEAKNYNVLSGALDKEKFNSGEYFIYIHEPSDFSYYSSSPVGSIDPPQAGEATEITLYDNTTDSYYTKTLIILAVIEQAHEYSGSRIPNSTVVLPDTLFQEIYPDYGNMIATVDAYATQELTEAEAEQVKQIIREEHNPQLQTVSRYQCLLDGRKNKETYMLIGFFISFLLAVIGISNVVNTLTASVLSMRQEYAAMQSVGMTVRQLFLVIAMESLKYMGISFLLMLLAGACSAGKISNMSSFTGFNAALFGKSAVLLFFILLFLTAAVSGALVKVLNRKSIVERLRDGE